MHRKSVVLIVVVVFLSTSVLACSNMFQNEPKKLTWDLSKGLEIENIGWSHERQGDTFSRTDDMELNLKLPDGKVISEKIRFYTCTKNGKQINSINLHVQKNTLEVAYQDAQRLIKLLDLPYKDLDEWYAGVKSGDFTKDVAFYSINNNSFPIVELNVRHSFNDEKPWFVSLELYFPEQNK